MRDDGLLMMLMEDKIMNEFEIHHAQPLNDELESLVELW